jgi:hypothetical protein
MDGFFVVVVVVVIFSLIFSPYRFLKTLENFGKLWKTLAHLPIYCLNCGKLSPQGNGHLTTATNKGNSNV